jgi:hypothetical protein
MALIEVLVAEKSHPYPSKCEPQLEISNWLISSRDGTLLGILIWSLAGKSGISR